MEPTSQQQIPPLPSYKEIIKEIGKELRSRKKLLAKRTLKMVWPGIVFILFSFLLITILIVLQPSQGALSSFPLFWPLVVIIGLWLLFTAIYYPITAWIFSLERLIWIKSYFDKENLSPTESWRRAKSIAWPGFVFMSKIFLKFYFLPISIFLGTTIVSLIAMLKLNTDIGLLMLWFSIGIIGIPAVLYIYYIRVKKLRFIWFVFLDFYQDKDFSFKRAMEINQQLNQIHKGKIFKRALLLNLGVDSVEEATQSIVESIEDTLAGVAVNILPPSVGIPLVGVEKSAQMFTEELISQATELSRSIAMYILYQYAWNVIAKITEKN